MRDGSWTVEKGGEEDSRDSSGDPLEVSESVVLLGHETTAGSAFGGVSVCMKILVFSNPIMWILMQNAMKKIMVKNLYFIKQAQPNNQKRKIILIVFYAMLLTTAGGSLN